MGLYYVSQRFEIYFCHKVENTFFQDIQIKTQTSTVCRSLVPFNYVVFVGVTGVKFSSSELEKQVTDGFYISLTEINILHEGEPT